MATLRELLDQYGTKAGYTMIAISIALLAMNSMRPIIEREDLSWNQRQLVGAALVFILFFLFGLLKNFIWNDAREQAQPAQAAAIEGTPAGGANDGAGKGKQEAAGSKGRKGRPPKA